MKRMFFDWLKLLVLTIVLFIIVTLVFTWIFCRPFFAVCIYPVVVGYALGGVVAFVVSVIIYAAIQLINNKKSK